MISPSQSPDFPPKSAEIGPAAVKCEPENGPPPAAETGPGSRARGPWLLPLLLVAVLAGMLLYSQPWAKWGQTGSGNSAERGARGGEMAAAGTTPHGGWVPAPRPAGKTVALTVDFGNGASREFAALPWHDGMTLADLMEMARHFRPSITYTQKGTGAQAFLTALEGVAHQANQGNFWFYEINGKRGIRSFGIQPLLPGDRVLWTFGPQE